MNEIPASTSASPDPAPSPAAVSPGPRRPIWKTILRGFGWIVLSILLLLTTAWATLAVGYTDLSGGRSPRVVMALVVPVVAAVILIMVRPLVRAMTVALVGPFVVVLAWFLIVPKPSNTRDWIPDVAQVASARVDGDRVTLSNVRHFEYRGESDYTPRWEQRVYDLSKLRRVDLLLCYWGSPSIAHVIVSFGFEGDEFLAVSIETRKERTESYSALQGFFRQYELTYVFADERDVVRLRTDFRGEDVYLYRTVANPVEARAVLMSYLEAANGLAERPEFYNALTTNCATSVVAHARRQNPLARVSWEVVLSGYAARVAHRNGRLDGRLSYENLHARSRVNDAAAAARGSPDFSKLIRRGLPDPLSP